VRSVPADLVTALTVPERVLTPRILCDWDGDGFNGRGTIDDIARSISSLSIDQVLTSDVPSAAQPVAGAAVAQLTTDVEQGHVFGSTVFPIVRGVTSSTAATGTGVVSITRGAVQPGDMIFVWLANAGSQYYVYTNTMSVPWSVLATRGDFNSAFTHVITARLLLRRVGITQADADAEPSTYTFNVPSSSAYVAHCAVVAAGLSPGIHALTQRGSDPSALRDNTYTLLNGRRITTTLDNCLILGFFAGYAGAGGGVTWTPASPATELADVCSTGGTVNAATCVTQLSNAAAGSYTLGATISTPTEPGVVVTIALAPLNAGDDTQNASWVFSELNGRSPIAGKTRLARPITAYLDVATSSGLQSVPLFTGQSLGVDVSSRARKATLTALDNRELMRGDPSTLPKFTTSVVAENPLLHPIPAETLPTYPGLEATWLVSYIFSYCRVGMIGATLSNGAPSGDGFFASPNVRGSTLFHAPCHGSLESFTQSDTDYAYRLESTGNYTRVTFDRGPWVASTAPAPVGGKVDAKWRTQNVVVTLWTPDTTGHAGTAGRFECYLRQTIAGSGTATIGCAELNSAATQYAYLDMSAARVLQLRLGMPGGITRTVAGPTLPNDQAWHAVGVHWDSVAGSATFRIDDTSTVVGFAAITTATISAWNTVAYATLTDGVQLAEFQVCGGYPYVAGVLVFQVIKVTDPWAWQNFTPTAFIDRSNNVMDATVPLDDGIDHYGLVAQLAEAEFAAFYFDADGHPHYRTRYSDVTTTGQTVQRTLTTLNALKDIDYQSGLDQLANTVAVSYTPVKLVPFAQIWQPSSPIRIPALGTSSVSATLGGFINPNSPISITIGNVNSKPDGSGVVASGVSIAETFVGVDATIQFDNFANHFDVWAVDASGNSTAAWSAALVESDSTVQGTVITDDDSVRRHGTQTIINGVSDSKWRQRQDVADALARLLLNDLADPAPVLTNVRVVGDPRLEIGDLVRFLDRDGLGLDDNYRIVGISPAYSTDEGFTQTLVARRTGCFVATWDGSYWDDCTVWGA
jgi:hypothetical protein